MAISTFIIIALAFFSLVALKLLIRGVPRSAQRKSAWAHTPTRNNSKRAVDIRELSSQERKFLRRAKALAAEGKFRQASQLLEQIGMHREAINILEEANLIDDAAIILMKMRRPNRAGAVYARHKRWAEASECFRQAGMPVEAAKCLWECQKYAEAAKYFLEGNRQEDAAACMIAARNWHGAAKLYLKLNLKEKTIQSYESLFSAPDQIASIVFDLNELNFIHDVVLSGATPKGFVDVLARNGRLLEVIRSFIERGEIKFASQLYQSSTTDLGPLLMSEINLQSKDAHHLTTVFIDANQFRYAGMVYEQMGDYSAAAQSFEVCNEFERASYCWDRAGDRTRAKLASSKAGKQPLETMSFSNDADSKTQVVADTSGSLVFQPDSESKLAPSQSVRAGVFAIEPTGTKLPVSGPSTATNDQDRKIFDTCNLFEGLEPHQLQNIWDIKRIERLDAGNELYNLPGEPDGLYIVLEGSLERTNLDPDYAPSELQPGDHFGENWVLANQSEQALFKAKEHCRLLILQHAKFIGVLEADGRLAYSVYKSFTSRRLDRDAKLLKPQLKLVAS